MSRPDVPSRPGSVPLLLLVGALVAGIVCLCVGTAFAKHLFPAIGAAGTTAYRVGFAALLLCAFWRPWRWPLSGRDAGTLALYGAVLGAMNLLFYLSLRTIPLGIAVAIEFTGPLAVALLASRRLADVLWIGLAALGLALLLLPRRLAAPAALQPLDPVGLACVLGAALCWALYIVFGQRAGRLHGGQAVSLGMAVAALVVLPVGVAQAGAALFDLRLMGLGLMVAILSSALPYSLEMVALKRLPRQTFGVLLSLEPAIAALAALAILGERLSLPEGLAIACIVAASAGSTLSAARARRAPAAPAA
ncbi:EamA family transporter [Methylobacterium soli]|uniref:DMT family transporter n=1 Tax=Methylobacterium soli TaxID=553447 RepID=A0A6L3SW44_9HYPH|nr:DMT family transporter [Methylobacterium soli]KAB1078052.1 DMT family transporter [Methylobacterium soli]GJE41946.1 Threonine/homoserine exporter RhtA [Methylobacterium soli]